MDIDAQLAERAGDSQRDGLARLVTDGVGHQLAGEQDRDVRVDRDVPGADGRPDLAAGFARRGRAGGQPDAAGLQLGGRVGAIAFIGILIGRGPGAVLKCSVPVARK
jgi:hypothetical protein